MNARSDRLSVIFVTLAAAVVLMLLPLPPVLDSMRPYWVALVIIYWCLETQDMIQVADFAKASRNARRARANFDRIDPAEAPRAFAICSAVVPSQYLSLSNSR